MSDKPKLIIHSASSSSNVWTLKDNLDYARTVEMDGMVMNGASSWNLMKPGVEISLADTQNQMAGFEEFNAEKHNYFLTQTDDPGDLFDDAAWAQVVENFRTVAFAAKEAGYKGLIFDNEEYNGQWQNFPEHYENADPSNELAYQNQAALRGKQIMEAINDVFPDAEVGVMHGPYMSVFQEGQPDAIVGQGGGPSFHELRGAFFTGLAEGQGENQTLIDMGELYALRSEEDFAQSQQYRSEIIQDLFDWSVPAEVRENWDELIVQSHMLYTDEYPVGATMSPEILETTLLNAFNQSEDVVFIFSSPGKEDWFTEGALDGAWSDAIVNATEAFFDETEPTEPEQPDEPVEPEDPITPDTVSIDGRTVVGTDFVDTLTATNNADIIYGLAGNDWIASGGGNDVLFGGTGNDEMLGGAGDDVLMGGAHGDFLYGGGGNDDLDGGSGDDNIWGQWGENTITGGAGEDWLRGGTGNDIIHGGADDDVMWGGAGRDTFVFVVGDGRGEIRDFEDGVDVLSMIGLSFDDLVITQNGDATLISYGSDEIELSQTPITQIDSADFLF